MWPLLGIVVVVAGFALRLNGILVVAAAALVTGLAAGLDLATVIAAFGKAFNENRYVSVAFLVLPVIGALERAGLQERARQLIASLKVATAGRILMLYLLIRQVSAAVGLLSLGGHATMVRPLIAPMAEAAAESRNSALPTQMRERIRAHAAGVDNIGAFFGEDIFVAIGSILLMRGFLEQNGVLVEPLSLSLWAIPTAIAAFAIHAARLFLLERTLRGTEKSR
ncbi:MAG: DUF969 domain-containing protein [Alphaproteobacteria bacterium]|nr:DUF969 domain-containing protein [Alphaproteobacteria bacterium]